MNAQNIQNQGRAVAQTMLEGFNKHYRMYCEITARAKGLFEQDDEEKSVDEISQLLDRPPKTIHTQLYRAKNQLQKKLKGGPHDG